MAKTGNFNHKILGDNFNDSTVIGIMGNDAIKEQFGFVDSAMLKASDFVDDKVSLGMLSLFEHAKIIKVPFISDALKGNDKIYVKGMNGSFDYEVGMEIDKPVVVQNVEEGDYLGIDESTFCIKLSYGYSPGDILSYDPIDGVHVIVIEDAEVIDEGDGFVHTVKLAERDRTKWFPKEKLVAGTEFCKIDHVAGEYSTQLSAPDLSGLNQGKVKLQFTLGDFRGVQVGYTAYTEMLTINGKEAARLSERVNNAKENYGADFFFMAKYNNKGIVKSSVKFQPIMESLALAELMKLTAMGVMFNKGATITGINGSKRVNEGLWHQLRRGHRFQYTNVAELRQYILTAADVIFQGTGIPVEQRKLVFKAGFDAHNLVREMFKQEFTNNAPVHIDQDAVPFPILSGSDRYDLDFKSYAIGSAFLNGIGHVKVVHDASLDYDEVGDYLERGYSGGRSKRSWTLVMWDLTDPMYSNVFDKSVLPKGVNLDDRTTNNKNLYIVKPQGMPDFAYGNSNGFLLSQAGQQYNRSQMGGEFSCASSMAAFIPDKGRVVMIEKLATTEF